MNDKLYCTFYGASMDMVRLKHLCEPMLLEIENEQGKRMKNLSDTIAHFDSVRLLISADDESSSVWSRFRSFMERNGSALIELGCDELDILIVQQETLPYMMDSQFAKFMDGLQWQITYTKSPYNFGNPWQSPTSQVSEK